MKKNKNNNIKSLEEYRRHSAMGTTRPGVDSGPVSGKAKKTAPKYKKPTFRRKMRVIAMLVIGLMLVVGGMLGVFMYRYSQISSMKYDLNAMDRELQEIRNEKQEIQVEIEHSKRSDLIEQIALETLGMQYPTEDQIIYISVD